MHSGKKIIALITARGGSRGIPGKNIADVGGKPLVARAIEPAQQSKYVDEVYVTTDGEDIKAAARKFGAKIIDRPAELATDTATLESCLLHAAGLINFDVLVTMQCASNALTLPEDIDAALEIYFTGDYDSVISVGPNKGGWLCSGFLWNNDGRSINYDYKSRKRRQEFDQTTYRENGSLYINSKENLLRDKNRLSGRIGLYVMPADRTFDLDEAKDLELLRKIFPVISKK